MGVEMTNCCGFNLKHGTIIIGVIQSILAFMFLVLAAAYAENPHELVDLSDPSIVPDFTGEILNSMHLGTLPLMSPEGTKQLFGIRPDAWRSKSHISTGFLTFAMLKTILIIIAVTSALQCVFSILLIFAAETKNPPLLLPWLGLNAASLCVYIIVTLIAIVYHTGTHNTIFIVGHLIFALIVTLIVSFKMLCVWSFYKHLKSLNF